MLRSRCSMAFPAVSTPLVASAASGLDIEKVLARLPAEARAQLAWARKPIDDGLRDLRTGELTDEKVAQASSAVMPAVMAIAAASWPALTTNLDEYRAALMQDLKVEQDRLSAFVETDDARDTLDWIAGTLRALYSRTWSPELPRELGKIDETLWRSVEAEPALQPFWCGFISLMAAATEAKHGTDKQRARDLLDVSFLSLVEFRRVARKEGLSFSPFPFETTEERRERLQYYAGRLRASLTDDDAATLDAARLGDLR